MATASCARHRRTCSCGPTTCTTTIAVSADACHNADIYWAKSIATPDDSHANALYVSEVSPVKRRFIVLDEKLSDMFPLERLCLLHEMVHVGIEPIGGHGEEFITEFKRVLDATGWDVMGCVDSRLASPQA